MHEKIARWFNCANWIPLRLTEPQIVELLDLRDPKEVIFEEGLSKVHINSRASNQKALLLTPTLHGFQLLMGSNLMVKKNAQMICEKISHESHQAFCFGTDIWIGYKAFLYAENGRLVRYMEIDANDELSEYGEKQPFEAFIKDYIEGDVILELSRHLGVDLDQLSPASLEEPAKIWQMK